MSSPYRAPEEVDSHSFGIRYRPTLTGRVAGVVPVHLEPSVTQARGELPITPLVQQSDLKSHVEIHGPDVRVDAFVQVLLVDDERRHQTANNHQIIHHVAELRGDVEAQCPHERDLFALVLRCGDLGLSVIVPPAQHLASQPFSCLRAALRVGLEIDVGLYGVDAAHTAS